MSVSWVHTTTFKAHKCGDSGPCLYLPESHEYSVSVEDSTVLRYEYSVAISGPKPLALPEGFEILERLEVPA